MGKPRLKECVENWPDAATGEYNPMCCRFPKSCSATVYVEDINPDLLEEGVPMQPKLPRLRDEVVLPDPFPGLREKWMAVGTGGKWDIITDQGNIIAYDIPMGAYADHIVKLHNDALLSESFELEDEPRCFTTPGVHDPSCKAHKSVAPVLDLPSSKNPEGE